MNMEQLVDDYIDAWNRQNLDRLLELMDKRATFYDAYWMEYCAGKDLTHYLRDALDEGYWFQTTGNIILVENSVAFRYTAHKRTDSGPGPILYNGAEVLTLREHKIVSVSDYYCNPAQAELTEVARLATKRHGKMRHAKSGLGSLKALHFKNVLSDIMDQDKVYLDAELTLSQLAGQVGCSVDNLSQVISSDYGTSFQNFLDQYRIRYASELLLEESEDPNYVFQVALRSGFRSIESFNNLFRRQFGETPTDYRLHHRQDIDSAGEPLMH